MKYFSTLGGHSTDLVGALIRGLAPDGRLYVPEALPKFEPSAITGSTVADIAKELLIPFFAGSRLADSLEAICDDALNFPIPLRPLAGREGPVAVLELFHGPTAAFKDVGARFLAAAMQRAMPLLDSADTRPLTILVATSGDTGGAVAAAFHRRPGFRVGVLFPKGQVSPRQRHQLSCWGDNIRSFEVGGSFDDCQAMVKAAFADTEMSGRHRLAAANSINIGRLLPQVVYHAAAALWHWRETHRPANFIVPTGNLGNAMACVIARAIGMPIGRIVLATNANRTIPDFLATGDWQPRASVATLASAMDVGNPSNMERLRYLYPELGDLRTAVEALPVDDDQIRQQISGDYRRYGDIWCPHTATAAFAYEQLPLAARQNQAWIIAATAHPAKFDTIVEPAIGTSVPVPEQLAELLAWPSHAEPLDAGLEALRAATKDW
jgi:threonine synthase